MQLSVSVHPRGLDPFQAAKAWQLRKQLKRPWKEVRKALRTAAGGQPGRHAVEDAIARIEAQRHTSKFRWEGVAVLAHSKCGRKPALTSTQRAAVVDFVKRWHHKRFCTASYIIQELRLPCKKTTVYRVLSSAGYHWRSVAKRGNLTEAQLAARKVFVDAHLDKSAAWWRQHFGLVLDGVALTKAPRPLSSREKHAAQAIKHMWVKSGEAQDNSLPRANVRSGRAASHRLC